MVGMIEIWKNIKGYEDRYLISNTGKVKSIRTNTILKQELRKNYLSVQLFNGNTYKHFSVHRLVGINFIDNPNNLPYINHKDENKLNNCVNNLEWCTCSYNVNYGTGRKRSADKKSIAVDQYDLNNNYIKTYSSFMEAERITKIPNSNIVKCCRGDRKTAGKFIWKYHI